jgi:hypothetical protein
MNVQTITPEVVLARYCSLFAPPITNTSRKQDITVAELIKRIRSDQDKAITDQLRTYPDENQNSKYKCSRFSAATISGTFRARKSTSLIHHSGLICIDIDNVGDDSKVKALKTGLFSDPVGKDSLVICFTSPNGNGVKAIYLIDHTQFSQGDWYNGICAHIKHSQGLEDGMLDKSGKDVARACFIPSDPDALIHPALQQLLTK